MSDHFLKNKNLYLSSFLGLISGLSLFFLKPYAFLFLYAFLWKIWIKEKKAKNVFLSAFLFQFFLSLIGFHWVYHTAHNFGNLPFSLAFFVLVIFSLLAHFMIPIYALLFFYLKKYFNLNLLRSLILLVFLIPLFEIFYPMIFKWNPSYLWLSHPLPFIQLAEYIGFYGLSFLILIFNLLFYLFLENLNFNSLKEFFKSFKKKKALLRLSYPILFFISLNLLGLLVLKNVQKTDSEISVKLVQGNKGGSENHYKNRQKLKKLYFNLSKDLKKDSLLIWPEVSYQNVLEKNQSVSFFKKLLSLKNSHLILGAYGRKNNKLTNSIFLVNPDGKVLDVHHKTHLLAFGEYLPFRDLWPSFLEVFVRNVSEFEKGEKITVFNLNDVKLGVQICYEALFSSFFRSLSQKKSNIFLNITNDSWFGPLTEPYQHLMLYQARAIEFRRPLIRVTNTGFSMISNHKGEILAQSKLNEVWSFETDLSYQKNPLPTFYERFFFFLCILLILCFILNLSWNMIFRK